MQLASELKNANVSVILTAPRTLPMPLIINVYCRLYSRNMGNSPVFAWATDLKHNCAHRVAGSRSWPWDFRSMVRQRTMCIVQRIFSWLVDSGSAETLLWTTALEAHRAKIGYKTALELVTTRLERILGLNHDSRTEDYLVFENDPFEFGARLVVIFEQGKISECYTFQKGEI